MDLSSAIRLHPLPHDGQRYQRLAAAAPAMFPVGFRLCDRLDSFLTVIRHTKPGGWAEFIDLDLTWTSPDGSLTEEHAGKKFNRKFIQVCNDTGIEACPGLYLEGWMKDAGFQNVTAEKFVWPVGTWPKDKSLVSVVFSQTPGNFTFISQTFFVFLPFRTVPLTPGIQKERGAWNYLQIMEGLEAFTYALFTRHLGYSKAEVEVICMKIRNEIKDPRVHVMFHLHVAYGQKPEAAAAAT
ncbi:MAG: hypothetical protein Q9220_004566 [cf. Caloplaca sp. 1 TL-2023]